MYSLFLLAICTALLADLSTSQEAVADPEAACAIFREGITNCTSTTSACDACPAFYLNNEYDIKDQNGGSSSCAAKPAGVYCFQIQSWISCCPDCQTPFDEYADCVLNTGRVIDAPECASMCNSGGGATRSSLCTLLLTVTLAVGSMLSALLLY